MKKINMLPVAEKEFDYSKLMAQVREESGIAVHMIVYIILFALIFVIGLIKPLLSFPLIGIFITLFGLDSKATVYQNGREVENNARNRLPLLLLGIFATLFGICGSIYMFNKSIAGFAAKIVLALMIATIASLLIGRLIYLIVLSAAAADRKRSCTCRCLMNTLITRLTALTSTSTITRENAITSWTMKGQYLPKAPV